MKRRASWRGCRRGLVRIAVPAVAIALCACGDRQPATPSGGVELRVRVRPFEVRGQAEGADYLALAFAQSLARQLDQVEGLRTVAVETDTAAAEEEPAELGTTRVVTGTLTRDAGVVRATLKVADPTGETPTWEAEDLTDHGDLPGLATRLARQTVLALGFSIPDLYEYIGDLTGGPQVSESTLIDRALEAWREADFDGLLEVSSELVGRFPDDATSHVIDAWALMMAWDADPSNEDLRTRLQERLRVLDRSDPASPYDELLRAYVYRTYGQPERARELYSQVLARRDLTTTARAWALRQRSFAFQQVGYTQAALEDIEEAVALDPASALNLYAFSRVLEALDRHDEAIARAEQALALQPLGWRYHQRLGIGLIRAERWDDAVVALTRACELGERQEACANVAVALHGTGRGLDARVAAARAESLAASPWGAYNLACYRAMAGQKTVALRDLRRAVDLGFANTMIHTDDQLDSLRDHPEFEAITDAIEERIRSRRRLVNTAFPRQASIAPVLAEAYA